MSTTYDNLQSETAILAHGYKKLWLQKNQGIFGEVVQQLSRRKRVSRQFVRMVFWGERKSARVERAFRQLRAPGFEVRRRGRVASS